MHRNGRLKYDYNNLPDTTFISSSISLCALSVEVSGARPMVVLLLFLGGALTTGILHRGTGYDGRCRYMPGLSNGIEVRHGELKVVKVEKQRKLTCRKRVKSGRSSHIGK
jgi:hypothetical protein